MRTRLLSPFLAAVSIAVFVTSALALTVTQTTNGTDLANALGGSGLTINSVTVTNGAASQFGTYTGFTSPPVTLGNGVVLSTGQVSQVLPAFNNGAVGGKTTPSTDTDQPGTLEFDAYGPGHITHFDSSNDVARLRVNFTLSSPSQVGFKFIFGSVEFPQFTSNFTDAFLAFLDGTAVSNQILFDSNNQAVQVGSSFASALTTADTNTAFGNPHGLLQLTTFTNALAAGPHSIIFEVGDVNDSDLDSAVFLTDFHAGPGSSGTTPAAVPEPATLTLFGIRFLGLASGWRFRRSTR